jgi:tetratricopeptide (TPR) repeat protein
MTGGKLRWIFSPMVALSIPFVTAPAFADQAQVMELNNIGVKATFNHDYPLAIQKLEEAVKLDPTYRLARENLGIAYNNYGLQLSALKKQHEALKQFHQALYLDPDNKTTKSNVDCMVLKLGKDPDAFEDRQAIGLQAKEEGDLIGAIIEYSAALAIKNDAGLHQQLGELYRRHGEGGKALSEFQAAKGPENTPDYEVKLGKAFQAEGEMAKALSAYQKAVALKCDDPVALDALRAGWEEVLKKNPLSPANHIGFGKALQLKGDFDGAEAEYKQAISVSPAKENAGAQKYLDALFVAKHQASAFKHINGGVDCQSNRLYDQAIHEYKLALEEDPNNVPAWFNLGTACQAKGDRDQAIRAYRKALSLEPSSKIAKDGLQSLGQSP